jgi:hypothetical protein
MYTRSQRGIKTKMETTIGLYGKGNEIISQCSLYGRIVPYLEWQLLLQSMLHQICINRINNDNVYQGLKTTFGDDNIHSSLRMVRGKGGKPLSVREFHSPM